ncbi:tetratricopeptide repeat protein [Clostridium sp. P21]|uniref:Tetratricopeptide repeat protein n=1 Tax=Clostridium muellerianum TaxID=2716538 RepID=A0A7Y0HN99_9CLOT|nr:tetratricopeptide repeat protein [Clostridium muellerianum]NMM62432.1 tetratricopeptide repeat protein [Clostridium muellerianum]
MDKGLETIVEEGLEFLNNGDYEKAEPYFNKVLNIDNSYAEGYYFRGYCYVKMKEYEKALIDLDKSIKLDPSDSRAYFFRNKYISLFKGNGCKSELSKNLSIENLDIKVEDFKINNNIGSAECDVNTVIWDNYMSVSLKISLEDEDTFDDDKIKNYIDEFKKYLIWLENNKKSVFHVLVEDDMIGLAEEWAESSDEEIIDGEKVYVDGEDIFRLPISKEEFFQSLYFNSISIRIDEDKEIMDSRIMIEAFIDTKPDYFAGHSMEVTITDDYKISVNGLAG